MAVVKIGLLGCGTVGCGVLRVLAENQAQIASRLGANIEVSKIAVRSLAKSRDVHIDSHLLTDDPRAVVNALDVDIVVELIGGDTLAKDLLWQAIDNGKDIVTANKALLAQHGESLFEQAREKQVQIAYEAAVAGGIPIVKALREGLSANTLTRIAGIVNGTSNYILTKMQAEQISFAESLAAAQAHGYAEADPTFDIEGIDAAHKLTILAAIAFGVPLSFPRVYTEGISAITSADIRYTQELGLTIKHLAIAERENEDVCLRVHPALLPTSHILAHVEGVMNAVFVEGSASGPTLYYGAGAGGMATASAVVADIIDVVRRRGQSKFPVPGLGFMSGQPTTLTIKSIDELSCPYYLRMQALDQPGVLADITKILATEQISIEVILQKETSDKFAVPVVILTHEASEIAMQRAISAIEALNGINGAVLCLRVMTLPD